MNQKLLFLLMVTASVVMISALQIACDDDDDDDDDNNEDDDETDDDTTDEYDFPFDGVTVKWEPCSLHEGYQDNRAECARVEMPFNWFEDEGRTFTVAAKRLLSNSVKPEGQMWLLHGGPGYSGTIDLPFMMESIQNEYPELDMYTIDPRGSGYSEYLGCPEQQSPTSEAGTSMTYNEVEACAEYLKATYGDDLAAYNTTNPAIDLAALIYATQEKGKKVLIWGGSGGTFWGHRFLQLFPDMADGVIFEGIEPADGSILFQDEYADRVTAELLQMCADDEFCSGKISDPEATLRALWPKMEEGHCYQTGMNAYFVKTLIDYLIYYYPYHDVIPALIYRFDRCNEDDVAALVYFYYSIFGGAGVAKDDEDDDWPVEVRVVSDALFFNELTSELWEHSRFADNDELVAYLDDIYADSLMGFGKGYDRNDVYLFWPRYTDELDNKWAQTDTPMLMLQGMLDPSTPYDFARELEDHFNNDQQHFVAFPYAPHNAAGGSPISSDPNAETCGGQLFFAFLHDPEGELDTSCVSQTLPPDFEGTVYAPYFFGTTDYWEGAPSGAKLEQPELPLRYRLIQRQIARLVRARQLQ